MVAVFIFAYGLICCENISIVDIVMSYPLLEIVVFLYIIIGIFIFAKFMVGIFVEFVMLRRVDFLSLFRSLAKKMTFALLLDS